MKFYQHVYTKHSIDKGKYAMSFNNRRKGQLLESWKELEKMGKTIIDYKLKEPVKLFYYVEH